MASLYDIPLRRIDATETTLSDYRGEVLLIVNVASQCGLTPQYAALEQLYETYHDHGFEVLGFPANDFGAQEPGTNQEIATFCETSFGVRFPMFEKIVVTGEDKHPLYRALIDARPRATFKLPDKDDGSSEIHWNFEKFLVDRAGNPAARFAPKITPDDPLVIAAIRKYLAA